ncbi:GGDEF domain-containing protein [Sphingomonas sp. MMS24-J13]|uniref:GGDEF domain-containing protein n=1 Tax=Sphingomonas sp. MMS24-J13 TaxID=3238686 RepID=UPI00384AB820
MTGAIVLLIVNSAVAMMFALCYFIIALLNRSQRPVIAFGISYLIGTVTPVSELFVRWSASPAPFMLASYISLLVGFLAMSVALSIFERARPNWPWIIGLATFGLLVRALIWGGTRDYLPYEFTYQLPFVLALLLCAHTTLNQARERPLHYVLAGLFGVIAFNFLLKPFIAALAGSGSTAKAYADSAYALFSQASTGILLIAAGLIVLLIVLQTTIQTYKRESETDHLSGLLNRRGLDRQAEALLAAEVTDGGNVVAIVIDLDHFKAINDSHGHDVGDEVIQAFARMLIDVAPKSALIARTGGEEFVVFASQTTLKAGLLLAEAVRERTRDHRIAGLPAFTWSAGIARHAPGESLSDLVRRADQAGYRAKSNGRDRIEIADAGKPASHSANVVSLRGHTQRL